jgi:hypothetical protein
MSDVREQVRQRYAAAAHVVRDGMAANDAPEVGGCCPPEEGLLSDCTTSPNGRRCQPRPFSRVWAVATLRS